MQIGGLRRAPKVGIAPNATGKCKMSKKPVKKKQWLHVPSFLGGLLLGGALASAVWAPSFLSGQFAKLPGLVPGQDDLDVTFEFPELLRQSEVPVDPSSYADTPDSNPAPAAPPAAAPSPGLAPDSVPARITDIYIQAASFREAKEADQLRARLLLQGLPASRGRVVLGDGAWYRVTVGPIESSEKAERIIDRLREQDLYAIRVNSQ